MNILFHMWYFLKRNNETWTGLFGRGTGGADEGYIQFGRDSSHGTRPYLHHRFGEEQIGMKEWRILYYLDGKMVSYCFH